VKRPVISIVVTDQQGSTIHTDTKFAWNSAITASEAAIRSIARAEGVLYDGDTPVVVASRFKDTRGDSYTRTWTSRQGRVLTATNTLTQSRRD